MVWHHFRAEVVALAGEAVCLPLIAENIDLPTPVSREVGDAEALFVGFKQCLKLILRLKARLDRSEKRAFGTPSILLDSTLVAASLCLRQQKRTMRKPETKSGL